jgi:hypothetical protein
MPNSNGSSSPLIIIPSAERASRADYQRSQAQRILDLQRACEELRTAFNQLAANCRHDVKVLRQAILDERERRLTLSDALHEHQMAERGRDRSVWRRVRWLCTGR